MRGLAYRGVVHMQIAANGAYYDFTGIESDTNAHRQAVQA